MTPDRYYLEPQPLTVELAENQMLYGDLYDLFDREDESALLNLRESLKWMFVVVGLKPAELALVYELDQYAAHDAVYGGGRVSRLAGTVDYVIFGRQLKGQSRGVGIVENNTPPLYLPHCADCIGGAE